MKPPLKITKALPVLTALTICLTAAFFAMAASRKPAPSKSVAATPAPAAGPTAALAADKGKFRILQEGKEAGTEDFEISQASGSWVVRGDVVIHAAGGDAR